MERKHLLITIVAIGILIAYYCLAPTFSQEFSTLKVIKITDGDTLTLENDMKVRLKGINTPETGMLNADKAKALLEELTLNKKVQIRHYGQDKYGRLLTYLFIDGQNINKEIAKAGLAHAYYYEEDEYYNEIMEAENFARKKRIGIWEKSPNSACIKLIKLDYFDEGNEVETLEILNACGKPIDVTIKDDATHIYKRILPIGIYTETFQNIWNDNGDSIYIWDSEGIVEFWRYP